MSDSPVMNIAIHGIGDTDPDYYWRWRMAETLDVHDSLVDGFYYEDVMDASRLGAWGKLALKLLVGYYLPKVDGLFLDKPYSYLQDIFTFFLNQGARDVIEARLLEKVRGYENVRIFGHSLGSIIAYWFLLRHPEVARRVELVTLGSPMGSLILRGVVKFWLGRISQVPLQRPQVWSWENIASELDPLSGFIEGLGCQDSDQLDLPFRNKTFHHEVDEYIQAYQNFASRGSQRGAVA